MRKVKRTKLLDYNKYDSISDKVLSIRGIPEDMRFDFISTPKRYIRDPFLLKNMDISVNKVIEAIKADKVIGIYGDPDADGITSTGVMCNYLSIYTDNIVYILNQREEGHGVIVDKVDKNIELLIIVDSSTNSVDECKIISEFCDIIILDHHEASVENPYATIVNAQTCDYENKYLSGSAVCYQFCRAFDITNDVSFANNFVDLAAVGLVGDMMDLSVMENRAIINQGLKRVKRGDGNLGLYTLFKELKKESNPTSQDIGYYVAPCLNAVIRLNDINILMDLFTCNNIKECKKIVKKIIQINEDRKILTQRIFENLKSREMIDDTNKIIIIDITELNQKSGLTGLIANHISKEYQKPCFLVKKYDGELRGSGRGFGYEIRLKDELNNSGLFTLAEGHQNSFGVGFNEDKKDEIIEHFNKAFKDYYNEQICEYDMELSYNSLNEYLLEDIDRMSVICGEGFPRPSFLIQGLKLDMYQKIGKEKNHTKLTIKDDINLDIMKFNTKEDIEIYENCDYINVIGNIGMNHYYNYGLKKEVVSKQILSDIIECETIDL